MRLVPLLLSLLLCSCGTVGFYTQAVTGQMEVMVKRKPASRIIADPRTDAKLRARLELTARILDFARDEIRMPSGGSYELYADLGRPHLVWVIHATPELSMEPKRWWYPIVGKQDYRGYFRESQAQREEAALRAQGYETWSDGVDAYSTLGAFRDPLLNTFIQREETDYAELIFHELAHRKYHVSGNTRFNEGLAEAVARESMRRWFAATGRPKEAARYELRLHRLAQAREAIAITVGRLRKVYASGESDDVKRREKTAEIARLKDRLRSLRGEWGGGLNTWINQPINNARLNSFTAYEEEVPRFTKLLKESGGDFDRFWERVKDLPK